MKREDVREQLTRLHMDNDCFYGLTFGEQSDRFSVKVGEQILHIGYWYATPFNKGFMIAADDELDGLTGLSFNTAQEAFQHVKQWAKENGLHISPYKQPRDR